MDIKEIFISVAVVLVGIVATVQWISFLNASYDTTAGSSFNSTTASVQAALNMNLNRTAIAAGNNTFAAAGAGNSNQQAGLVSRSVSTVQQIGIFFTIVPNLLGDGAAILGVPEPYASIAGWVFAFILGITIAFIFLQIVERLL